METIMTLEEALERIAELEKENAELKEQISILLSCKSCSENKGGYICEKEYNDKCLAQKNEYIKELKAEIENYQLAENESKEIIAELKEQIEKMKTEIINFSTANSLNKKYNSYQKLLELAE